MSMSISNNIGIPMEDVNSFSCGESYENYGMPVGTRVREARKEAGISQEKFAKMVGIRQATLSDLETGKSATTSHIAKMASILKVNALWLETGRGPKKSEEENIINIDFREIPDNIPLLEATNIEQGPDFKKRGGYPLISWVQAGEWTELCDNFQPGDAEDWKPCHKDLGKCGYVLRVKGESMTAPQGSPYSFPEGMLLYINPDIEALPGKFVIVRRNGTKEATFKRYVIIDGKPYLEAINPTWPTRYLELNENDQFCGVVVTAAFDNLP